MTELKPFPQIDYPSTNYIDTESFDIVKHQIEIAYREGYAQGFKDGLNADRRYYQ